MSQLKLQATIEIREGNPYILISHDNVTQLKDDWRKPMPVLIHVNGKPDKPWHINMMPVGDGDFYLYLHGDVRKASNTEVGDTVEVEIAFDDQYHNGPLHEMPDWFRNALAAQPTAKQNWDKLIPSRQKEILRYFSWLKTDEAKERNLEKAMKMLSGEPGRFMARSWKDGK